MPPARTSHGEPGDTAVPPRALPTPKDLATFRATVLAYFAAHGRDLPWRRTRDPYRILVSEIMLQQTQVPRVLPKYEEFLERFPDIEALAAASLSAVLETWQGLGYNRRAVLLKRAAERVHGERAGRVPRDYAGLMTLPGVGPATAAAVAAFAYGEAQPLLETNIRAVYLHHFFADRENVSDREVLPLVEATMDRDDPRTWYYALMDYGVWLKRSGPNPSRRSRHHVRQSPFTGSKRQLRAQVLGVLLDTPGRTLSEIARELGARVAPRVSASPEQQPSLESRLETILRELQAEGFLVEGCGRYRVPDTDPAGDH